MVATNEGLNQVASLLASGEASSVELTTWYLARIERLNPTLSAFWTVTPELALQQAEAADRRRREARATSALGLPIGLKDNIDTAGMRTTRGSAWFATNVPARNAEIVTRLRRAGAVILGKLAMDEFAYGATGQNEHFGSCRNPWNIAFSPGGSSAGAGAAVSAQLCAAAVGTDTGGSVRIPAALTGVVGVRPTFGSVSTSGVFPLAHSFDAVGPVARSVEDTHALLTALASRPVPGDPTEREDGRDLRGVRVGVGVGFLAEQLDSDVAAAVTQAVEVLRGCGASVQELALDGAEAAYEASGRMIRREAFELHRRRLGEDPSRFGQPVERRLELGRDIQTGQIADDRQTCRRWRQEVKRHFKTVDVIVTGTAPTVAPPATADMIEATRKLTRFTQLWSAARTPAISVPCGLSQQGLPIGLQLTAGESAEPLLLRVARAFEATVGWAPLVIDDLR